MSRSHNIDKHSRFVFIPVEHRAMFSSMHTYERRESLFWLTVRYAAMFASVLIVVGIATAILDQVSR